MRENMEIFHRNAIYAKMRQNAQKRVAKRWESGLPIQKAIDRRGKMCFNLFVRPLLIGI